MGMCFVYFCFYFQFNVWEFHTSIMVKFEQFTLSSPSNFFHAPALTFPCTVSVCMGTGPSAGAWEPHQGLHPRGENVLLTPTPAIAPQLALGFCDLLADPCWTFGWLDLMQTYVSSCVQCHREKTLFPGIPSLPLTLAVFLLPLLLWALSPGGRR